MRQVINRFGAEQDVRRVQDLEIEGAAEAVGQQADLFFGQQRTDRILDVGGFLLVRRHHEVVATGVAVSGGYEETFQGTGQSFKLQTGISLAADPGNFGHARAVGIQLEEFLRRVVEGHWGNNLGEAAGV